MVCQQSSIVLNDGQSEPDLSEPTKQQTRPPCSRDDSDGSHSSKYMTVSSQSVESNFVESDCFTPDSSDEQMLYRWSSFTSIDSDDSKSNKREDLQYQNQDTNLRHELKLWAAEHLCTNKCVNDLLSILNRNGHTLPKDKRTLLNTVNNIEIQKVQGGSYCYFGLEATVAATIEKNRLEIAEICLQINIDGLPIFKSSSFQLWPVLARFSNVEPFVVALYGGSEKPRPELILTDLVQELARLQNSGIYAKGKRHEISVFAISCDAPARSLLRGTVSHTGYFACERCTVKGLSVNRRIVFHCAEDNICRRTDADFRLKKYFIPDEEGRSHQHKESLLLPLAIDLVNAFSLDVMHCVYLGVVRRLLYYLRGLKDMKSFKLSSALCNRLNATLVSLRGQLPSDFTRQPRSLLDLERWKATEFRTFLLYIGMVALKDILSEKAYFHFLSLSISLRILCDSDSSCRNTYVYLADDLLRYFVYNSHRYYGDEFCVYNVHLLLHLVEDATFFSTSLDQLSTFPFENFLGSVKRLCHGKKNVFQEITNRLSERAALHKSSPTNMTKIAADDRNCWFCTANSVLMVKEVLEDGSTWSVVVYWDGKTEALMSIPTVWVRGSTAFYPPSGNAYTRFVKGDCPDSSWMKYTIVKMVARDLEKDVADQLLGLRGSSAESSDDAEAMASIAAAKKDMSRVSVPSPEAIKKPRLSSPTISRKRPAKSAPRETFADDDVDFLSSGNLMDEPTTATPKTRPTLPVRTSPRFKAAPRTDVKRSLSSALSEKPQKTSTFKTMGDREFQYTLLMEVQGIKRTQERILEEIRRFRLADSQEWVLHPVSDYAEFTQREEWLALAENRNVFIEKMSHQGGKTLREAVRNCLDAALERNVQGLFNKDGSKGKKSFKSTIHFQCIATALVGKKEAFDASSLASEVGFVLKYATRKNVGGRGLGGSME